MKIDQFVDDSVDFLIGQASIHNLDAAFEEFWRVLRSWGKCIFAFEPLNHNRAVNGLRSIRNAKLLVIDDSTLYLGTLRY